MARVDVDWHGDELDPLIVAAAQRGLRRGLRDIAETSQDRVLVQTGELKRSNYTDVDGLTGVVGYTDSKAVGAHENLAVTPRRGKQAKFLETALTERADDAFRAIADEVKKAL